MKDNRAKHFMKRIDTLNRTIHKFRQFIAKMFSEMLSSNREQNHFRNIGIIGQVCKDTTSVKENPSIKLRRGNPYLIVSIVDPKWFQCEFGPCFLPQ
jgi:hypothetical protein